MYQTLLYLHSWSRWFVVIFGLIAVYRAYVGYSGRRPFLSADNGMSAAFSGFIWLQVLVGLALYVTGGWPAKAASAAMDTAGRAGIRFFKMEHVAIMILAAIVAQVGRIVVKKNRRQHPEAPQSPALFRRGPAARAANDSVGPLESVPAIVSSLVFI